MRRANVGGESRLVHACPYSIVAYERAFGPAHSIHEDVNAFMEAKGGPLVVLPVEAMLRLLYAYEASAGESAPVAFDAWVRALPESALDQYAMTRDGDGGEGWATAILNESVALFFPSLAREDVAPAEPEREEGAEGAAERA